MRRGRFSRHRRRCRTAVGDGSVPLRSQCLPPTLAVGAQTCRYHQGVQSAACHSRDRVSPAGTDRVLAQDLAGGFATRFTSSGSVDTSFGQYGGATVFGSDGRNRGGRRRREPHRHRRHARRQVRRDASVGFRQPSTWASGPTAWRKGRSRRDAEARAVAVDPSGPNLRGWDVGAQFAARVFQRLRRRFVLVRQRFEGDHSLWASRQKRRPSPSAVMGASSSEAACRTGTARPARRTKCSPSRATPASARSIPRFGAGGKVVVQRRVGRLAEQNHGVDQRAGHRCERSNRRRRHVLGSERQPAIRRAQVSCRTVCWTRRLARTPPAW